MKTALSAILTASLLAVASLLNGRSFDAVDFTAIVFASGLVAWTIEQYSRSPRALTAERPIRFPISLTAPHAKTAESRLAA